MCVYIVLQRAHEDVKRIQQEKEKIGEKYARSLEIIQRQKEVCPFTCDSIPQYSYDRDSHVCAKCFSQFYTSSLWGAMHRVLYCLIITLS